MNMMPHSLPSFLVIMRVVQPWPWNPGQGGLDLLRLETWTCLTLALAWLALYNWYGKTKIKELILCPYNSYDHYHCKNHTDTQKNIIFTCNTKKKKKSFMYKHNDIQQQKQKNQNTHTHKRKIKRTKQSQGLKWSWCSSTHAVMHPTSRHPTFSMMVHFSLTTKLEYLNTLTGSPL